MNFVVFVFAIVAFACNFQGSVAQKDYETASLVEHNKYRALHKNTPGMVLDDELNKLAQKCAKYYVDNNKFDHSCPYKNGSGENLYTRSGTKPTTAVAALTAAAKAFYNEIKDYDYNSPGFKKGTGHFTQLVWVESTKLGAGFFQNAMNKAVTVNLYRVHGNMQGKGSYEKNVQKPK